MQVDLATKIMRSAQGVGRRAPLGATQKHSQIALVYPQNLHAGCSSIASRHLSMSSENQCKIPATSARKARKHLFPTRSIDKIDPLRF